MGLEYVDNSVITSKHPPCHETYVVTSEKWISGTDDGYIICFYDHDDREIRKEISMAYPPIYFQVRQQYSSR